MTVTDRARAARAARRPARGGRRWRRVSIAVVSVLLALVVAGVVIVWATPAFSVHRVTVHDARTVDPDRVRQAASIADGTRLTAVDDSAVRTRILDRFPAVASVSIGRHWPSRISLDLTERTPVVVVGHAGNWRLVDTGGHVYEHLAQRPAGLVRADLVSPGVNDAQTRAVLDVVTAMPTSLRGRVASISVARPDAIALTLRDKRTVSWGGASDSDRKAAALIAVLPKSFKQVDLSAGDTVVLH